MKKVLVLGPGGAGKSTFARKLADRTGLPAIHLDGVFWRPGWVQPPIDEWKQAVGSLLKDDAWIMDGNFGETLDMRLVHADTVILLDLPPWLCLWRVMMRRLRFHGRSRPDMTPGCNEQLDASFLWWILSYRARRLPRLLRKLEAAERQGKRVVVLRTQLAVDRFVGGAA